MKYSFGCYFKGFKVEFRSWIGAHNSVLKEFNDTMFGTFLRPTDFLYVLYVGWKHHKRCDIFTETKTRACVASVMAF